MNIIFPSDVLKYRNIYSHKKHLPIPNIETIPMVTLADKVGTITQSQATLVAAVNSLVTPVTPGDEVLNDGEGIAVIPMKLVYVNLGGTLKTVNLRSYILPTQV